MMNAELKLQLQSDLKIKPYKDERPIDYECRLIYSAMAEWMRTMVFDETTDDFTKKSKGYLLTQGKNVLNSFVATSSELKNWFMDTEEGIHEVDDAIKDLRNKMLAAGEYIELFPSHDLTLPMGKLIPVSSSCSRMLGAWNRASNCKYVGVTRITESSNVYKVSTWKVSQFLQWIQKQAKWENVVELEKYEFFNPYSTQPPYKSWIDFPIKNVNIHLGRISLYNGLHEYYLFHQEGNEWKNALLPTVLAEGKEERRIILGLRNMCNNSVSAKFERKGEVGELKLFCRLPLREESYIETYCWPRKFYLDKLNYIAPMEIWPRLKGMLQEELGMKIEEGYYG